MFDQMQSRGCTPDVVTYTALISALERGGQWQLALEAFQQMLARGCEPDAIVYNAIIDALWQTGVVWAQVSTRVAGRVSAEGQSTLAHCGQWCCMAHQPACMDRCRC